MPGFNRRFRRLWSAKKDAAAQAAHRAQEPIKLVSAKNAQIPRSTPAPRLPGSENRVHHRATLSVQVDFESDHNFFTGFSADISEGGSSSRP